MKELSKEERLNQRIAELEQLIEMKCDEYSNKKWLRVKRTLFILSGVVYLIVFILDGMNSIQDYLGWLISALTIAGFIMFISYLVMHYITANSMREEIEIAKMIGELNAVKSEKYNNLEAEKIKELKRHIEYLENHQEKLIEENVCLRLNKVFDNKAEE